MSICIMYKIKQENSEKEKVTSNKDYEWSGVQIYVHSVDNNHVTQVTLYRLCS